MCKSPGRILFVNNHLLGPTGGSHIHMVGAVVKTAELVHCGAVPVLVNRDLCRQEHSCSQACSDVCKLSH